MFNFKNLLSKISGFISKSVSAVLQSKLNIYNLGTKYSYFSVYVKSVYKVLDKVIAAKTEYNSQTTHFIVENIINYISETFLPKDKKLSPEQITVIHKLIVDNFKLDAMQTSEPLLPIEQKIFDFVITYLDESKP